MSGARRDVLVAGLIAVIGSLLLAYLFSRSVTRPVVELRDVARAIAAGDLDRRPSISAPGEIGDLATALHRMSDQLATRLHALEADDALMSALLESINEGVVAVSGRGSVVRLNESARELLGVRNPVPFPADRLPQEPAVRAALRNAMSGTPTELREMVLFAVDSHRQLIDLITIPLGSDHIQAASDLYDRLDARDPVPVGCPPHRLALRLDARHGVEHRDRAVEDPQRALDLVGEVDMAQGWRPRRHRLLTMVFGMPSLQDVQLYVANGFSIYCGWTDIPKGGHFAAMEQPLLLANDIIQFVKNLESYN